MQKTKNKNTSGIFKPPFPDNIKILWKHINRNEIYEISKQYKKFLRSKKISIKNSEISDLLAFFVTFIEKKYQSIDNLKILFEEFNSEYAKSNSDKKKNTILIKFANTFGKASLKKRIHDKKALRRFFNKDAATERYQKHLMSQKKYISALFRCLPAILISTAENNISKSDINALLDTIFDTLRKEPIAQLRIDILSCLTSLIKNNLEIKKNVLQRDKDLSLLIKILSDTKSNTWEKCEVLNILTFLEHDSILSNIKKMIDAKHCDDIFVRRHSATLLIENLVFSATDKLLNKIMNDPSAFVRQKLAKSLSKIPKKCLVEKFYSSFLLRETDSAVTCSALKNIPLLISVGYPIHEIILPYQKLLQSNLNSRVIEFALLNLVDCFDSLKETDPKHSKIWLKKFSPIIEKLHCNAKNITTRRIAAQTRELLWCRSTPQAQLLLRLIKAKTESLKPGKSVRLLNREIKDLDDITVGRVLAVISQNNCALELKKSKLGYHKLLRNYKFGFKWWRLIHEFRTPSPDKRQTFSHTRGRLFRGQIRSASSIMSELSETKVPGEPLFISDEGNSRPYLPLPDEILSAAEASETIKVFTSEGITSIKPPKNIHKRLLADIKFAFNFKKYAALRNWKEGFQQEPSAYIEKTKELGFDISITPYQKSKYSTPSIDPKVKRFFSIQFLLPLYLSESYDSIKVYFLSLYQNTLPQLAIFVVSLLAIFFGRHITLNTLIRRSRTAIPLVIGGWGTRGKSGTERIKAALFASLGCSVVSKTTGCEAMFLYTPPFEKTHEFFLFRPYDKVTIWEQFNIFRLADKLKADVFLWECMALTPSYVRILQEHWMKDNISTITNTYPDHEDIQGPAGWNVAESMTNFIPKNGNLITTEEQFFPFLETTAKHKKTKFSRVDWRDAILITADILERFPYEEHPHNIALVLKMAEELGIEKEYALKEMADNVVPDIGVLKKYPIAEIKSRKLEFFSGMSANERYACIQNWSRMELDTILPQEKPDVWITTVVNNRADRVARSKVFAKILVEDLRADKHVLIGNNLKGMLGYIKEAWSSSLSDFSLWNKTKNKEYALKQFDTKADFLRIPRTEKQLKKFLSAILTPSGNQKNVNVLTLFNSPTKMAKALKSTDKSPYSNEIVAHYKKYYSLYIEYCTFVEKINKTTSYARLNKSCKTLLWKWFRQKIIVVSNYSATGNQVIEIITDSTPPGIHNKIMALQNIKGTGLDFFYRWQAWENCHKLCQKVKRATNNTQLEYALRELSKISNSEILTFDTVAEVVSILTESKNNSESVKILLNEIKKKFAKSSRAKSKTSSKATNKKSNSSLTLKLIENFLDPGDSIKRKRMADCIYKDLAKNRISYNHAILKLQEINKKQKGGWLKLKK